MAIPRNCRNFAGGIILSEIYRLVSFDMTPNSEPRHEINLAAGETPTWYIWLCRGFAIVGEINDLLSQILLVTRRLDRTAEKISFR